MWAWYYLHSQHFTIVQVEGAKIRVEKSVQNLLMDLMVCSCFVNFMESILLCLII
jgi:hypothetical protein